MSRICVLTPLLQPVQIDDAAFIGTSFPGFADLMRSLGADLS